MTKIQKPSRKITAEYRRHPRRFKLVRVGKTLAIVRK